MRIIATILCVALVLTVCPAIAEEEEEIFDRGEFYPLLTVVIIIEENEMYNTVTCLDRWTNLWSFFDEEPIGFPPERIRLFPAILITHSSADS